MTARDGEELEMRRLDWMLGVAALALVAGGCDDGDDEMDAGHDTVDAGGGDEDAGSETMDAGGGDEDAGGGDEDAGGGDEDAGATGGGHCDATDLIIEAVDPGNTITIFNPTDAAIAIDGSSYAFCERPMYPTLASLESGVTIAAGSSHDFPWPVTFASGDAGGELALYATGGFGSAGNMLDFVCWGTGRVGASRQTLAESGGLWSGDCAGAITGDALTRIPDTDGTGGASYDPTGASAALTCD